MLNAPRSGSVHHDGAEPQRGHRHADAEWWGDQADAASNDKLELNGLNVINPAIAPRARRVLAVFNFDSGSDGVTDTSAALFPFSVLSFLTGVDNFLPASPDASGTIAVEGDDARLRPRRDNQRPELAVRSAHVLGVLQGLRRQDVSRRPLGPTERVQDAHAERRRRPGGRRLQFSVLAARRHVHLGALGDLLVRRHDAADRLQLQE